MRLLAEAVPPVGPVTLPALAALFALCALIVAIGMVKLVDAISRSFFGTIGGAIGWIPFAGKVVQHSLHKIEQKISHGLGSAERKLDAGVAWTWNNCAHLVTYVGTEIEGLAKGSWHIAQQAQAFVRQRDVTHEVRAGVKPVNARAINAGKTAVQARHETHAVSHSVATGVYPRIKAAEWEIDHVLEPSIAGLRSRTKALEHGATRTFAWIRAHPLALATTAFAGAVAIALTRLGVGWIRCKNWRYIGKHICGLPFNLIEGLLGGIFGVFLFSELCRVIVLAGDVAATVLPKLVGVLAQAEAALCGGRYSATPAMELSTTALPTVDNPLTF